MIIESTVTRIQIDEVKDLTRAGPACARIIELIALCNYHGVHITIKVNEPRGVSRGKMPKRIPKIPKKRQGSENNEDRN